VQLDQIIQQGVAGFGRGDNIARGGDQAQDKRIGLAGAGCEKNLVRRDVQAAPGVIIGDRAAAGAGTD